MPIYQTERARGGHALHLVDADLDHLERVISRPANRMLNAQYWRRRVLSMQHQFELTHEQGARAEAILQRLDERGANAAA